MSRCDNCIYPYCDNIEFDVCYICATEKDMYTPMFTPDIIEEEGEEK